MDEITICLPHTCAMESAKWMKSQFDYRTEGQWIIHEFAI
jgi:hypothetical protein